MIKALIPTVGAAGLSAVLIVSSVWADGPTLPAQVLPLYKQECAACHTPYPPGLLPSASWRRIMGGLERHYGTDASLEAAQVQQINTWLTTHAGTFKRVRDEPPEDRITRSAWFVREHREVEAAVWKRKSVQSAAQCSACHSQADAGRFGERELRIPR